MPQLSPTQISEATEEDLRARAAEMRSELAGITEERAKGNDKAWTGFLSEIELIDKNLDLIDMTRIRQAAATPPPGAMETFSDREMRSAGELIAANEEFRSWMANNASRSSLYGPSPAVEVRDLVTSAAGSGAQAGLLYPVNQPFLVGVNRQRLFIRDLLSVNSTTLAAVHYVRATKAANATGASTVAEATTKPETAITFVGDIAPMQVIAANIPITTQVLDDAQTVVSYINGQLVYELKLTEEAQVLNGAGTGADLKGIRTYSEVQSQAYAGTPIQTIALAIGKVEIANGVADGVALNPANYWAIVSARAAGGSGTLDAGNPFQTAPLNMWGLPTVRTNGIEADVALVGSYTLGATLWDRQQANVRVYEQHSDFAVKNKVLLQAEERVGLSVSRPDWFVEADLSA